eukprot:12307354-Ditylum_brightwellii.AAC.1
MYCYKEDDSDGDSIPSLLSCHTKDSSDDESWGINDDDMLLLIPCHNNNSNGDEDSSINIILSLISCQNDNSWIDGASNTDAGCDNTSNELVFDPKNNKQDFFTDITCIKKKVKQHGKLSKNWLLLDNQSTVNIMSNRNLVTNIQKASTRLFMG